MKTLSITALIFALVAGPAGAAVLTIQDGDSAAQCGLSTAHLIDFSQSGVIFPDESRACRQADDESAEDGVDVIRMVPASAPARGESSLEIATLSRSASK
jgi:hypothetical protein